MDEHTNYESQERESETEKEWDEQEHRGEDDEPTLTKVFNKLMDDACTKTDKAQDMYIIITKLKNMSTSELGELMKELPRETKTKINNAFLGYYD